MGADWRVRPYVELDATADKPLMLFLPWEREAEILRARIAEGWIGGHEPVKSLEELLERQPKLRATAAAGSKPCEWPVVPVVPVVRAGPPTKLWED